MDAGLKWLFLDINAYFASCEQQARPELRGRPIAIRPVAADTTCCIAVSYQAKAYGVRTGMSIRQARQACPHILFVEARPRLYVEIHHRIVAAIERCIPIDQILSCDEFSCRLVGRQCQPEQAAEIAYAIKQELRTVVGTTLRCSIGLGPNRLLAKIAGEMQKPDGFMVLDRRELPHALHCLSLSAVPGIGRRMEKRIRAAGIETMQQLTALPREAMSRLWGGVLGDRMWLLLRGEDLPDQPTRPQQTLSRQHILPPTCRTPEIARDIACKMLHAIAVRLRRQRCRAAGLWLQVGYEDRGNAFQGQIRFAPCNDTFTLQAHMDELWKTAIGKPSDLTVVLTGLISDDDVLDLFPSAAPSLARNKATTTMDKLNARYGSKALYLGSTASVRDEAPTRISFGVPPSLADFEAEDS
jgi:DNA polymerase-4